MDGALVIIHLLLLLGITWQPLSRLFLGDADLAYSVLEHRQQQ